ncbi:MAG TPA: efflux RND transporter periplasmic adaptor subunit, partial [Vicinamibacteria bacterium]
MRRSVAVLGLIALGVVGAGSFWLGRRSATVTAGANGAVAARYRCPMHPSFVSDKPGECRICGMKLVEIGRESPGRESGSRVPGRASLSLTPEKRQLLGVRSEPVHAGPLARVVRTVGRVAVDERRLHHIHVKYDGYVEHLYVDFTGQFVSRGEPLLSIYSPELVATQQEYLLALSARKQMEGSGIASLAQGSLDLLEAARQRLLLWDMRSEDIAALERAGKVGRTIDLHSEVAGYVVQKMAFHGMRVTPA